MNRIIAITSFLVLSIFVLARGAAISQNYYPQQANSYQKMDQSENVLIILDASYSMNDKIDGVRKIDTAKRTINQVLSQVSTNVRIGLRVYGHKSDLFGFKSCRASELKVPIAANTATYISRVLSQIQPVGWTPITYSLQQAMNDFRGVTGKKRIILVSDGKETCDGSPCEYILNLVRSKVDLKIDVIGYDLDDPDAISQLKCTALATKGKFYPANNQNDLANSLIRSLNVTRDVQGTILKK